MVFYRKGIRKWIRKIIHKKEESIRAWAHRSLVTIKDIQKGEILTTENIWGKRPGTGISPMLWDSLIGKIAKKNYFEDDIIELWLFSVKGFL